MILRAIVILFCIPSYWADVTPMGCFNKAKEIESDQNDLWLNVTVDGPRSCLTACPRNSFRYAGLGTEAMCWCGSSYGRNGISSSCDNCSSQPSIQCGTQSSLYVYDTQFTLPSAPLALKTLQKTENAIKIAWEKPLAPNSPLKGYSVTASSLFSYSSERIMTQHWELEPELTQTYLIGLTPGTKYNVSVQTVTTAGRSQSVSEVIWTSIGVPDAPPSPTILWHQDGKMRVSLQPVQNTKGPVSAYRLALIDELQIPFFNKDNVVTWNESLQLGYSYYVSAEFSAQSLPSEFTLGKGDLIGKFYNGPLPSKGHWHPTLGIVSSMEGRTLVSYSSTSHDQHSHLPETHAGSGEKVVIVEGDEGAIVIVLWVAVGIGSLILLVCVLVFLLLKLNLLSKRRRRSSPENHQLALSRDLSSLNTSSSATYHDECLDGVGSGYTHAGFVSEEEDWRGKCIDSLQGVKYLGRQDVMLPVDSSNTVLVADGKYGAVYRSECKSKPILLFQLPSQGEENLFKDLSDFISLSSHPNVMGVLGWLEEGSQWMWLGVEEAGVSLKTHLVNSRGKAPSPNSLLLCAMAVAEALFHLHTFQVKHGKVAAWNVLIRGEQIAEPKLTGFGVLSCDPPGKTRDYTRWTAVEQFHNRCVSPCDSWPFGVLLWEIASLGGTPFPEIRTEDIKARVGRFARPTQLDIISDDLYQIMLNCWQLDREERPDPSTLACSIHELLPHAQEHLFLSPSFIYPPFVEEYEFLR